MEGGMRQALDVEAERIATRLVEFLETYETEVEADDHNDDVGRLREYIEQLDSMKVYGKTTMYIDYSHLVQFDDNMAQMIIREYYRFEPALRSGIQRFVQKHKPGYEEEEGKAKEFYASVYNLPVCNKLRNMRAEKIGQLAAVSGVVTRTSEVRPELLFGTFTCLQCGQSQKDVAQQFKYTQPAICMNATCANRDKWVLERQESKFVDWQRLRLQESSDEVPAGSLPRSLDVILRHEIVEQARAGDKCIFTGTLVVVPDVGALSRAGERSEATRGRDGEQRGGMAGNQAAGEGVRGLKALGTRDLSYKLAFLACSVQAADHEKNLVNIRAEEEDGADQADLLSPEEKEECNRMKNTGDFYEKIAASICPAIYGHLEVKRAIALMLFGGCHKKTPEGISLRGDINVCIVGDPSCAKSQFLKYVSTFLPRAIYTSGKSSSAAGLTASVVKEPETGEFCIEAGALMLADNGICCIDEFDKMDIKDQVAIHEAMEQQTISIAKAGIQATLNARTSILAAANPTAGRYDKSKPLKYNVNLPPAILSRFDLVHVMIDDPDTRHDKMVAQHIVNVHQLRDAAIRPEFTTLQLQKYIKYARTIKPQMTKLTEKALVDAYVALRRGDAAPGSRTAYRITVRQLEALIRLSEALARLNLDHYIEPKYVREAKRLLSTSIISVESHSFDLDDEEDEGPMDDIDDLSGFPPHDPRPPGGGGEDDDHDMDGPDGPDLGGGRSGAANGRAPPGPNGSSPPPANPPPNGGTPAGTPTNGRVPVFTPANQRAPFRSPAVSESVGIPARGGGGSSQRTTASWAASTQSQERATEAQPMDSESVPAGQSPRQAVPGEAVSGQGHAGQAPPSEVAGSGEAVPEQEGGTSREAGAGAEEGQPAETLQEARDGGAATKGGNGKEKDKAKVQVSYDKFQQVARTLAEYLRQREKEAEEKGGDEGVGMKQGDLVRWYVGRQNEMGAFASTQEVIQEYRLVRSIIQHLIRKEGVLLVLDDGIAAVEASKKALEEARQKAAAEGLPAPQAPREMPTAVEIRVLALNPNYVVE